MEDNLSAETKLIAIIGLLVSVLLVVSVLFGIAYFSVPAHIEQEVDVKTCHMKDV
ncbi:hypothetical protein [Serratia aquatilis]|uniref:Uncharacterized protein n=1 Tax=Serratia aquatilis TaxID=1737515 RepID=A0ABV6E9J8_9GAMM